MFILFTRLILGRERRFVRLLIRDKLYLRHSMRLYIGAKYIISHGNPSFFIDIFPLGIFVLDQLHSSRMTYCGKVYLEENRKHIYMAKISQYGTLSNFRHLCETRIC